MLRKRSSLSLTTAVDDMVGVSQQNFFFYLDTDLRGRTAFSTYSIAKVLATFCQQWEPTESESEKAEKLPPYFTSAFSNPEPRPD